LFDLKMMITYISVKLRVLCLNKTLYFWNGGKISLVN
jgi:hypothetical protein